MKNFNEILTLLKKNYNRPKPALNYNSVFELLVATILSAQCTDKQVNRVTKVLFKKYNKPEEFADLKQHELEDCIKSTGFFRNKAKNIINASKIIVKEFDSKVPSSMNDLLKLPGVARKTANIVLGHGFNKQEGIAIDTHCIRLTNRFKWVNSKNPNIIEKELMEFVPKKDWTLITDLLINHGRNICTARNPNCKDCFLNKVCASAFKV